MSQLVRLRVVIGGAPVQPPVAGGFPVVLPNPVTIVPGVPTTVTVKWDDGTGTITDLPSNRFLVAFWSNPSNLGITATAAGHTVTLLAPVGAPVGATADLDIDVRP